MSDTSDEILMTPLTRIRSVVSELEIDAELVIPIFNHRVDDIILISSPTREISYHGDTIDIVSEISISDNNNLATTNSDITGEQQLLGRNFIENEEIITTVPRTGIEFVFNKSCIICSEEIEDNQLLKVLNCQHMFHQQCINKWMSEYNNVCPLCRQIF